MKFFFYIAPFLQFFLPKIIFHKRSLVSKCTGLNCIIKLIINFNLMSVIFILLILYLHKENHMYACNFIFKVLLQKQTFLHQSTHQPIYIPISNILCSPDTIVWRNQSPLPPLFCDSLLLQQLYYYMKNCCNLICSEQWHLSLI